jgi:nucleotide-binding universal stress UspA family protein
MRSGFISTKEEKVIAYVEQLKRQHAAHLDEFVQEMLSNLEQNFSHHLQPKTHLVKGSAHKEIPALAKRIEADLVVMGTAARTGVSGFKLAILRR